VRQIVVELHYPITLSVARDGEQALSILSGFGPIFLVGCKPFFINTELFGDHMNFWQGGVVGQTYVIQASLVSLRGPDQ
jgi:hypothetical protein